MSWSSQPLLEPVKLSTIFEFNSGSYGAIGVQSIRIPRHVPSSIVVKKLNIDFHGYSRAQSVQYSVDILTSLPRGVTDGFSTTTTALAQIKQLYDLDYQKLVGPSPTSWTNDSNYADFYASLTALPQRGVKFLGRVNGTFAEKNEYQTATFNFKDPSKVTPEDIISPVGSIVTVDNEFVVVVRLANFDGNIDLVRGVIGLEVS